MKSLFLAIATTSMLFACGQEQVDKSTRPSPPVKAKETLTNGTVVTIDYSQPSVKGRTIGKDLEPMEGKVWRTGANEATVFEVSKTVKIAGKDLPAGKYGLFTIVNGDEWTFIFNKTWNQWGAFKYNEADDVLRIKGNAEKGKPFAEKLAISISKAGKVTLLWGDTEAGFKIE